MTGLENTVKNIKKIRDLRRKVGEGFRGLVGVKLATDEELEILIRFAGSREFSVIRSIFELSEANSMQVVWKMVTQDRKLDATFPTVDWLEGFGVILGLPVAAMSEQKRRKDAKEQKTKK